MSTTTDNPSGAGEGVWARSYRVPVAGVLGLMTFIAFEAYAVITALPVVAADLEADDWYSFAFAATVATALVGMIVGGDWADRSGVRTPLAVGGTLFLSGLALCALAPGMGVFIAGRLLQGLGGGIDSVVAYVLIARLVPGRLQPRVFGLMVAAWLLPGIAGPLVTGVLVDRLHWRAVFAIVLAGSAVALGCLLGVARRAAAPRAGTAVIGRRAGWAAVACLGVVGLHLTGHWPTTWMVAGTVLLVALVGLATQRIMPAGTLTVRDDGGGRPGPPRLIALKGLLGAAVAATDIYLTHYLQRERDYSPTLAGFVVALGAVGWFAGSWLQGRRDAADAASPGRLQATVMLVLAGPVAVLALVSGLAGVPVAVAGCVVMGTGMGLAYPRITAAALARTDPAQHGGVSSALQSIEQLGTSTLTAVTGAVLVVATAHGYLIVYALVVAVGCLPFAVLRRRGTGSGQPVPRKLL